MIDPAWFFSAGAFGIELWLALALDALLGDPARLPHPVVLIGTASQWIAGGLRKMVPARLVLAGFLTVLFTLALTLVACLALFFVLSRFPAQVFFSGSVLLLYTTLALRGLIEHAMNVHRALTDRGQGSDGLAPAQAAVGRIVGRTTSGLDEEGIVRACVESVAENMSDGVVAPMLYAMAGSMLASWAGLGQYSAAAAATAAMLYKAINTMDSMFGYKNDEFLLFGKSAALLDDAVNFLPARIAAISLLITFCLARIFHVNWQPGRAGMVVNISCARAWKIMLRDHGHHASPNGGWPESAMAAILGIRLGGPGTYFGTRVSRPFLGDALHKPEPDHIGAACLWMGLASLLAAFLFSLLAFICVI